MQVGVPEQSGVSERDQPRQGPARNPPEIQAGQGANLGRKAKKTAEHC